MDQVSDRIFVQCNHCGADFISRFWYARHLATLSFTVEEIAGMLVGR